MRRVFESATHMQDHCRLLIEIGEFYLTDSKKHLFKNVLYTNGDGCYLMVISKNDVLTIFDEESLRVIGDWLGANDVNAVNITFQNEGQYYFLHPHKEFLNTIFKKQGQGDFHVGLTKYNKESTEIVIHHINTMKHDNRFDNLAVIDSAVHRTIHGPRYVNFATPDELDSDWTIFINRDLKQIMNRIVKERQEDGNNGMYFSKVNVG